MLEKQKRRLFSEVGAAYLEYTLSVSLIAVTCIVAIEAFANGGIQGAFCKIMHANSDLDYLIQQNLFDPSTGECFPADAQGNPGGGAWEFDDWV